MFPEGRILDFLIVGAVALIVVGPKDLPLLMRKVGQFTARVRGMAAEFRASFDELARQSELDELRREVQSLRTARPLDYAARGLGADGVFSDIDAGLAQTHAAMGTSAASGPSLAHPEPAVQQTAAQPAPAEAPHEPPVTPEASAP
jgi:sec-independent protein translocase protein TatB